MNPEQLIDQFVIGQLDGDINNFRYFPLYNLKKDEKYGCPNRNFDCDDTNIMRAVYCLVFADAWKRLSPEAMEKKIIRGDTMNTRATIFGKKRREEQSLHPGLDYFKPSSELSKRVIDFIPLVNSIGNMTPLPNKGVKLRMDGDNVEKWWTLNSYRGCCPKMQDYMDRFLHELHKILTSKDDKDQNLALIVEVNRIDFEPYYGEDGWRDFIKSNMLEYYCDENFVPIVTSKDFTFWRNKNTLREEYLAECERYLEYAENIIQKRSKRIINLLKQIV